MTLHEHIEKHWRLAAIVVVVLFLAYSVTFFW
jgi:hypothetical protein